MFKSIRKFIFLGIGSFFVLLAQKTLAADLPTPYDPLSGVTADSGGLSLWVGGAIQTVMGVIGSIALLMFIYAGFKWMSARGNSEQVKSAQGIMLWTFLGIAVIFSSYAILDLIFKALPHP